MKLSLIIQGHDGGNKYWAELRPEMIALFVAPFILLLLAIALLPLFFPKFWEHNKNKAIISLILGAPIGFYFLLHDRTTLLHTMLDYVAFISLLASLFIISGGIYIRGSLAGLPIVNTGILAIGAILANLIGTTGASMFLIRPLIKANKGRIYNRHIIIFFIFIVSNIGGLLTPLGDPPLYLGFLKGVPFDWTLRLFPMWITAVGALLVIFNLVDQYFFNKEDLETKGSLIEDRVHQSEPIGIDGAHNFLFLIVIVLIIVTSGYLVFPESKRSFGEEMGGIISKAFQVILMGIIALISYLATKKSTREKNFFTFNPIIEVALLFAGIFLAMIPALLILEAQGSKMGVSQPWQFFWASGGLSSFLDNAPTYLTYTSLASGLMLTSHENLNLLAVHPQGMLLLAAISCGAVFMGANTYIGNGPNFMVKAIAEEAGIKMPSFFGYMKWSIAVLVPLFLVITFLFFR